MEDLFRGKAYPVHPAAETARLMYDDELSRLASLIKANGQRDPITLGRINGNSTASLVDGRNRLKACEIAGVEPKFETKDFADDDEVRQFVLDRGAHRDLTKGQRAMQFAMLYPEPEKGGRGRKSNRSETEQFSKVRLSEARSVLHYSHTLACAVRDGGLSLDDALAKIAKERSDLNSNERLKAELRAEAPDLADLVDQKRQSLDEAMAALRQRRQRIESLITTGKEAAAQIDKLHITDIGVAAEYGAMPATRGHVAKLRAAADQLEVILDQWGAKHGETTVGNGSDAKDAGARSRPVKNRPPPIPKSRSQNSMKRSMLYWSSTLIKPAAERAIVSKTSGRTSAALKMPKTCISISRLADS